MPWQSITDLVRVMNLHIKRVPPQPDLRLRAASLAVATYGPARVSSIPALINLAALTLSMQDRLIVHRVSSGVTRLVHETDLHTLPGEPPRLLRGPWIIEGRDNKALFGNTVNLAGYPLDGSIYLIGLDYPGEAYVSRWTPHWREEDLEETVRCEHSPLIDDVERHYEWTREAARFALVLALHLEAEGSPVVTEDRSSRQNRKPAARARRQPGAWVVRRVYLDRHTRSAGAGQSAPTGAHMALDERLPTVVTVRGHLKRQAYGPRRSERRWIYVESYEARRWISPRPLRVEIGLTKDAPVHDQFQ